jgi:hypothetical protein
MLSAGQLVRVSLDELVDWWVSELVRELLGFSRCELLLLESGS